MEKIEEKKKKNFLFELKKNLLLKTKINLHGKMF